MLAFDARPTHPWQRFHNVNESSRLSLVKAILEEHTLSIDAGISRYCDIQDSRTRGPAMVSNGPSFARNEPVVSAHRAAIAWSRATGRVDFAAGRSPA